jgi:gpW
MATLVELQTRLSEAQTALHNALIGKGVTEVRDFNGESIRYSKIDTSALRGYIKELEDKISSMLGTASNNGPMRIFF